MYTQKVISFYSYFHFNLFVVLKSMFTNFIQKTNFITKYYKLADLIWQEGFLFDFLQKKIADNWVKKFLIYSSYLFNERFVFDKVTRFYLDLIIWPAHKASIFEFNNVSNTLFINIFFFIFSFFLFSFFFLWSFVC